MAIEISDWNDLNNVRNNLTADCVLVNSLDKNTAGYDDHASSTANGGNGWNPIGDSSGSAFTGTFDGQDYEIAGLEIDRSGENGVGLFSLINTDTANVSNLTIRNASIYGNGGVGGGVGTLVGKIENGTIKNCLIANSVVEGEGSYIGGLVGSGWDSGSSLDVTDCAVTGGRVEETMGSGGRVGGLVGGTDGMSITSSFTDINIVGRGPRTAGLVGNIYQATIDKCCAFGNVSNLSYLHTGGLIGRGSEPDLKDSYAMGDVTCEDSNIGGVAGTTRDGGEIKRAYSTGDANNTESSNDDFVGGFIGYEGVLSEEDWYYDGSPNNGHGTQLSTSEMQGDSAPSNMGGFDFSSTWETVEGSDIDTSADGYPILQAIDRKTQLQQQGIYQLQVPSNVLIADASVENELTVDWDEISGADGYYVYRAQSSGASKSDYTQVADVTSPPYTDTGLEDGEQYYYRVSVYN